MCGVRRKTPGCPLVSDGYMLRGANAAPYSLLRDDRIGKVELMEHLDSSLFQAQVVVFIFTHAYK